MGDTMQAVIAERAGDADVLRLVELPRPIAAPGQLLIEVVCSPLNPLDIQARAGRIKWSHPGFPFIPGCGFAGRVAAVGDGCAADWLGARVTVAGCWGGNAQWAAVPEASVTRIPDRFDWLLGAVAAGTARTAWHLVHSAARVRPGQVVVIHSAAGAVGLLTAQMARAAGAHVIGLAGGPARVAFAARYANQAINYLDNDWVSELRAAHPAGADVIIDGNSGAGAALNLQAIATLGTIIYMGAMAGPATDLAIPALIAKSCTVSGFVVNFHEQRDPVSGRAETEAHLASGEWQIPVTETVPLQAVAELHQRFEARQVLGRAVVQISAARG